MAPAAIDAMVSEMGVAELTWKRTSTLANATGELLRTDIDTVELPGAKQVATGAVTASISTSVPGLNSLILANV